VIPQPASLPAYDLKAAPPTDPSLPPALMAVFWVRLRKKVAELIENTTMFTA